MTLSKERTLIHSIQTILSPPPEERCDQGKSFFSFFVNSISAISCFFFSMYCIGSMLDPNRFPTIEPNDLSIYPKHIADLFHHCFRGDDLQQDMEWCLKESSYWKINNIHRVLMHRGMPPRRFHKGGELHDITTMPSNLPAPSDHWQFDLPVDEWITASYRQWLSIALGRLVNSASIFCDKRL